MAILWNGRFWWSFWWTLAILISILGMVTGCASNPKAQVQPSPSDPSVMVTTYPRISLHPGDLIVTTRLIGELPECAKITWSWDDGTASTHEACPPERSYRMVRPFRNFGRYTVIVLVQPTGGRKTYSGSVVVQVGP